jgi:glutamyl/glutaminyl-tRNA synthetase
MGSIEEALAALDLLEPGERPNYTEFAKIHSVDRSTLSKRHRGIQQSREAQYEAQSNLNHQ